MRGIITGDMELAAGNREGTNEKWEELTEKRSLAVGKWEERSGWWEMEGGVWKVGNWKGVWLLGDLEKRNLQGIEWE